jgi:hypothetical protein
MECPQFMEWDLQTGITILLYDPPHPFFLPHIYSLFHLFFYYDIVVSFVLNGVILLLRSAFSTMGCKGDGSRRQFLVWFLMVGDV